MGGLNSEGFPPSIRRRHFAYRRAAVCRLPINPDGRRLGRKTMSTCTLTHREFPNEELTPLSAIRPRLAQLIRSRHPELAAGSLVSLEALGTFRAEYVRNVLEEDIGAITALEHEVVRSMQEHELLASNVEQTFATKLSFGERLSDRIADIGGSWRFIIGFGVFLGLWILANILLFSTHPPDPYPFILLNLILSCLAALQAPVIMMSQNRQEAKDRLRAEHDYKVNLKAELEIRHLHEKVDYLLKQQAQRLFELQDIQIELMEELAGRKRGSGSGK
jgi:uncharacterized membrane protein